MNDAAFPTVSIVLEWETGGEFDKGRAERCIAEINRQLHALAARFDAPPELILVRGAEQPESLLPDLSWPGRFEIVAAPAGHAYYQKKNFGFSRASGAIVLFLDSALAPEPGWLAAMIAPFAHPARLVVTGRTHFETRTLYDRAMALFWIFETRCPDATVRPARRLVSNNIAFRRG